MKALAILSSLFIPAVAHATLIFDLDTNSTGSLGDEAIADVTFSGGFSFTFYNNAYHSGTPYTSAKVCANGGMTFPSGVNTNWPYGNSNQTGNWWRLNPGLPAIAALYDDLNNETVYHGPSKIGGVAVANSYSLTWSGGQVYGKGALSMQVSLFNGAQTVTLANGHTFDFHAGDVAISYGSIPTVFDGGTAVVGVAAANGSSGNEYDGAANLTDGRVTDATSSLLPSGEFFYLFRWNSSASSYDASLESFGVSPQVSITNPTNNATFTGGSNITIDATATDADGTVTLVEFFQGTTKLGEAAATPFSCTWYNVPAGDYTLTAVAHDNDSRTTTSAPVAITVGTPNIAPSVNITSPSNNSSWHAPVTLTLNATASDTDGTIAKVEFYQGTTKLGESTAEPYSCSWAGAPPGSYTLVARAYDDAGASTDSTAVHITVTGLIFDKASTRVQAAGDDVNPVDATLPFGFAFFGTTYNSIRLGSNGGFGVPGGLIGTQYDSSQTPWYNTGAGKPVMAPLWDDLNTTPGGGIYGGVSKIDSTTYPNSYSFTVPGAYAYGSSPSYLTDISFQVSLFGGLETVVRADGKSFTFQTGDIAFSYALNSLNSFSGAAAAVGISDGAGAVVGMPGLTNGILTDADRASLPTGDNFLLFRSDGAGSYTASIAQFGNSLTPLETWRLQYFGSASNSGNGADNFDFDNDGYANVLEYALGLDPTTSSPHLTGQWTFDGTNTYLTILITRPNGRNDVAIGGETTADPAGPWLGGPDDVGVTITDNGNGTETVKIWDKTPLSPATPRHFLRVKATP